jgi:hypothetical protein
MACASRRGLTLDRGASRVHRRSQAFPRPLQPLAEGLGRKRQRPGRFLGDTNWLVGLSRLSGGSDVPSAAPDRVWMLAVSGFAESPTPLVAGFAAVSVAWLLVEVGLRRQA